MLKLARTQCYRLRDAAIQTHMSRIACQVVVTTTEQQALLSAILQQKGRFSKAMQSSLQEQTLVLPSSKLSLRQLPKWKMPPPGSAEALRLPRDPDKHNDDRASHEHNNNTYKAAQAFFADFHIACPACKHRRNKVILHPRLNNGNWKQLKCETCKQNSIAPDLRHSTLALGTICNVHHCRGHAPVSRVVMRIIHGMPRCSRAGERASTA